MSETTAAILVIGDEILSGKTEEQNARFLIAELRELGVALRMIMVVPDEVDQIAEALGALAARHTYVFTSGGVGPTHDDVTLVGVSRAFNSPMHRHPEIESMLRGYFGENIKETHLRMADVPEGAAFIFTPEARWPVLAFRNVFILPGVPEFFRAKFLAIRDRFRGAQFYLRQIYTRQDEFAIAQQMRRVAEEYPQAAIGSYPAFDRTDYRVKITIESKDADTVQAAFEALRALLDAAQIVKYE